MAARNIGCGKGKPLPHPSISCDFFAEYIRRKGPGNILEWADRFRTGRQFHYADIENTAILLDIMVEGLGDGTRAHIPKNMDYGRKILKKFCEKHIK